ncbi:hypothetical protein CDAR_485431 [Caerostris darwini]|uniref:Uncharacterized protein n=1 Tax=Caerostris darwini TaxID=1538125 RepID=A0AAV4PAH8_9ARAC|nr:hypothetical protein CDAR_485431 [Caerostris darwini]
MHTWVVMTQNGNGKESDYLKKWLLYDLLSFHGLAATSCETAKPRSIRKKGAQRIRSIPQHFHREKIQQERASLKIPDPIFPEYDFPLIQTHSTPSLSLTCRKTAPGAKAFFSWLSWTAIKDGFLMAEPSGNHPPDRPCRTLVNRRLTAYRVGWIRLTVYPEMRINEEIFFRLDGKGIEIWMECHTTSVVS